MKLGVGYYKGKLSNFINTKIVNYNTPIDLRICNFIPTNKVKPFRSEVDGFETPSSSSSELDEGKATRSDKITRSTSRAKWDIDTSLALGKVSFATQSPR